MVENARLINQIENETEKMSLIYMQNVGKDLSVLSLAKVFDRYNNRFRTLSIPSLLVDLNIFESERVKVKELHVA